MCYYCFDVLYCHLNNLNPPQVKSVLKKCVLVKLRIEFFPLVSICIVLMVFSSLKKKIFQKHHVGTVPIIQYTNYQCNTYEPFIA